MTELDINLVRPKYRLLDEAQIQKIHTAVLQTLETVGVRIMHEDARNLLKRAGCRVEDNIAQIPAQLVESAIKSAPSSVTMYNRLGEVAMRLEGRNIHYGLGTDLITTFDLESGEKRNSVLKDVQRAARVADYCKEIDFIASFALPSDVATNTMYIECVKAELENSIKPIFFTAAGAADLEYIIWMAETVMGGADHLRQKPILINYSEPTPPLVHSQGAISKLFLCAEKGVPICYTPAAMLGATAPVTLAGALVQTLAEALSGIVLHQLKSPGAPIISGVGLPPIDMRTTSISYTGPEIRLGNSAFADIYHFYGLPHWSTTGSDSHCLDAQAASEHTFGILMAALDGANLIHDVGYLGQGLLGNPAAIVMCNEIISYTKRILRGFSLDDEMMALDVIQRIGPGGNYLGDKQTRKYFKSELWQPQFFNREVPAIWETQGRLDYQNRIVDKTKFILREHQPVPLDPAVQGKLDEIVREARINLESIRFVA
jgi:trimethylamine--corrinoid protein Co-methyltransferase